MTARLLDTELRAVVGLNAMQRDGLACIRCGREHGSMVPVGRVDGVQVFAHELESTACLRGWRWLVPNVYTCGPLSIERAPVGTWTVWRHAGDARELITGALRGALRGAEAPQAPECLGSGFPAPEAADAFVIHALLRSA